MHQMGFAKTGIAIDQKGVIILGRMLCHGHGSGVSQLVGGAHHEVLKGKFRVGKAVRLSLRRGPPLELQKPGVVQNSNLEVDGKDIPQGGLDVVQKEGLQVAPFKIAGAVELADAALDIHNAQLIKPGGDGSLGERPPELTQDIFPDVGDGVQTGSTSLFIRADTRA